MIPPVRSSSPRNASSPHCLDRWLDRLVVDLIEIDDDSTLEIRLLTKRHVDKTESVVVHGFDYSDELIPCISTSMSIHFALTAISRSLHLANDVIELFSLYFSSLRTRRKPSAMIASKQAPLL